MAIDKTGKLHFLCCTGENDIYFLVNPKLQKKSHKVGIPVGPTFEMPCNLD